MGMCYMHAMARLCVLVCLLYCVRLCIRVVYMRSRCVLAALVVLGRTLKLNVNIATCAVVRVRFCSDAAGGNHSDGHMGASGSFTY